MEIKSEYLEELADRALAEDIGAGDVTTQATVAPDLKGQGLIVARAAGVISGLDITALVFSRIDPEITFSTKLSEGSVVAVGECIAEISGRLTSVLVAERTALNFLMHLSGIATLTSRFVKQIAGTGCKILDTRKTTPTLRLLEKRAVKSGGGENHRLGLYDMILIKENHISAAGSLTKAIEAALRVTTESKSKNMLIEVEVTSLDDVREAARFPIDRIMLDNFDLEIAAQAVKLIREQNQNIEIEASGNMTFENVRDYAETGVDFISAGALTHSARWLDLSLQLQTPGDLS